METFQIISFFVFVFFLICLIVWYCISLNKQLKLRLKQETEDWEKFKSQIKPGVLLRIESSDYTPFDESKYEIIEILEIRDGWVKYNFIDKNKNLKRDLIDKLRNIYGIGYEIYRKRYEIVQPADSQI